MASLPLDSWVTSLLSRLPNAREEALAVVNGAVGDRLAEADSSFALPLALFQGTDLVDAADPSVVPCGRGLCVLVHGLMGSQHAWSLGTQNGERIEYGSAFDAELGLTPLYVRYNSGRHVSQNGRALAEALEHYLVSQARPPETIDFVSHSMGGLVTRSALHYAIAQDMAWPALVQRVFLLGTPNQGARLEQLAHVGAFTLDAIWNPWTKIIGKAINLRSAGIKDLRHGFCLDEDWRHKDQDDLRLSAPRPTRAPPGVRFFVVAGQMGRDGDWWSRLMGDGLVRPGSATGRGSGSDDDGMLRTAALRIFEQRSHLSLMNEPEVLSQIIEWWQADEACHHARELPLAP